MKKIIWLVVAVASLTASAQLTLQFTHSPVGLNNKLITFHDLLTGSGDEQVSLLSQPSRPTPPLAGTNFQANHIFTPILTLENYDREQALNPREVVNVSMNCSFPAYHNPGADQGSNSNLTSELHDPKAAGPVISNLPTVPTRRNEP